MVARSALLGMGGHLPEAGVSGVNICNPHDVITTRSLHRKYKLIKTKQETLKEMLKT